MKKVLVIRLCLISLCGCKDELTKKEGTCTTRLLPIWNGRTSILVPFTDCN